MSRKYSLNPGFAFFSLFVVVSIVISIFGCVFIWNAWKSHDWPHADATIITAYIEEKQSTNSHGDNTKSYRANVTYEYSVDGDHFFGSRLYIGPTGFSNREREARILEKYEAGSVLKAAYDPGDPSSSVLHSGVQWPSCSVFLFGLYFTLGSLGFLSCTVERLRTSRHYAVVFVLLLVEFYVLMWTTGLSAE